jgi:hypothetical protein
MLKRTVLTFGIVIMSAVGCSSSSNTPADAGKKNDASGDTSTTDSNTDATEVATATDAGDAAADVATPDADAGPSDASDAATSN